MTGPLRPAITPESEAFWAGCREGVLRVQRCSSCDTSVHPPRPICPHCRTRTLAPVDLDPAGVIESFTVSATSFRPDLPTPYVLAVVQLAAAPEVRLTTRLVDADPAAVAIGQRVRFEFEVVDDELSVPVARVVLDDAGQAEQVDVHHAEPGQLTFTRFHGDKAEDRAVISGIAMSQVGRKLFRSDLDLALEAALGAIEDAGLSVDDIDGIAAYPGEGLGPPGYAGPRTDDVADALGLSLAWHRAGAEGAAQLQPVMDAVLAVAAGLCSHALVYRASTESTTGALMREGRLTPPAAVPAAGFLEWLLPFDSITAAHWLAPYATAHMHRFGTTRAQLGAVAVNARANAARTPGATFTEPLTLDDHASARLVSSPFGLLDCDVLVDGAVAVVVSRADAAPDLRRPPVRIEAMGTGLGFRPSWDQWPDLTTMGAIGAAATMWARTDLRPVDVDVAQLYDGFTFLTISWLEALGFCEHGDGGAFVGDPGRIGLGGELPLNTSGGQLSFGRLHGWGLLHEACVQLRGEGDARQVSDAEVAVVSSGGGPIAGSLLLTGPG